MLANNVAMAEFLSKTSSAGVVNVELGFVPDYVCLIADVDGTNPIRYEWINSTEFPLVGTAALSLLTTGSSGIVTRDTSGISVFAGGTTIASAETTNSDPKHVTEAGAAAAAGHITAAGVAIPADHQVASGKNFLMALRRSR